MISKEEADQIIAEWAEDHGDTVREYLGLQKCTRYPFHVGLERWNAHVYLLTYGERASRPFYGLVDKFGRTHVFPTIGMVGVRSPGGASRSAAFCIKREPDPLEVLAELGKEKKKKKRKRRKPEPWRKNPAGGFQDLVSARWNEMRAAMGIPEGAVQLSMEVSDSSPHFKKKRGFAVCYWKGDNICHLAFAPKIERSPKHRADAIVRHELGHVVDFIYTEKSLDGWAAERGIRLPHTPERRADAIALAVWGEPIRYDKDLVQSTHYGVNIRPEHLGL